MADVNHVLLIGRLTRDAELKYTATGQPVCKFGLAVNRRRKDGDQWVDEANFFDIVIFGKTGESISQFLVKGKQVAVEGELRQDRWEQDGQTRSKVEIIANNVQLLGGGNATGAQQGAASASGADSHQSAGQRAPAGISASANGSGQAGTGDSFTDDIPF